MNETKLLKNLSKQITKDFENFNKRSTKERTHNYLNTRLAILEGNYKASFDCYIQHATSTPSKEAAKETAKVASTDSGKEEEFEEVFQAIKETYLEYRTALLDAADKLRKPAEVSVSSVKSNIPTDKNVLRLPKINLPNFSGNYEHWKPFHDLFSSLIHNNNSLSDIDTAFVHRFREL